MAGLYEQASVDRVQQANNIVEVISEVVRLAKKGKDWVGICPFHEDHRPSMYVSDAKQIFKCFACGAGGDAFKFVQMREGLTFPQAIGRLAERAGIQLEPVRSGARGVAGQEPGQSGDLDAAMLARVNDWACRVFESNLHHPVRGKAAREYVAGRGIGPETTRKWRMGLASGPGDDLIKAAAKKGISKAVLVSAGLVSPAGQDRFVQRLMFAIVDATGRVIGFGGRIMDGAGAKYVNSPTTVLFDKSNTLYGLVHARRAIAESDTAVVVEGYTDCILAHQAGCENVVATLGTSLTSGHGRLLRRYAKTVVLVFDSDTAGRAAANRVLDVCLRQRIDVKITSVPDGKDPADFVLAQGGPAFRAVIAGAVDVMEFKWTRLTEEFASDQSLAGRKTAVDEFLQTVATSIWAGNVSVLDRGIVVHRLSGMMGLGPRQIETELARRIEALAQPNRSKPQEPSRSETDGGLEAVAQREVLEVLLNEPGLADKAVEAGVTVDTFTTPTLREVARVLLDQVRAQETAGVAALMARTESLEVARCIADLTDMGYRKGNFEVRLQGALSVLARSDDPQGDPVGVLTGAGQRRKQRNVRTFGLIQG